MKVICDVEANGLVNPSKIWVIVCKDYDTGNYHIFREVTDNGRERERFIEFAAGVTHWVGHNWLEYDYPVLRRLCSLSLSDVCGVSTDTLLVSRLVDYSRELGHSIEAYGQEFGQEKIEFTDFSKYSQEMETYCVRDVDICERVYRKYSRVILSEAWKPALDLEHRFQSVVNSLHDTGFCFNRQRGGALLEKVKGELHDLDTRIAGAFPVRAVNLGEVHPRVTRHGTLNKSDFRWLKGGDLTEYNGDPFCRVGFVPFNASSHRQIIDVLNQAGWQPTEKTKTHIETERNIRRTREPTDVQALGTKLKELQKTGWKVNEDNLATLPPQAPEPARLLAKRILLESRRRTLTEWLSLVGEDNRIHGRFYGIGAWTHRMAHQKPNTANIPNEVYISTGKPKLLGKEMRQLWCAPKKRLLVGVDAEAIQLRIFAHLIDDPELTNAIVNGKKSDGTDPHSLNRKVFGPFCKTRNAAKHSLYAIFFGGRKNKIKQIMACSADEAQLGIDNLLERYPGLRRLEEEVFPIDAKRGYFIGLDRRRVRIPDNTISGRKHLCMSGYLQNGEAVVMKRATLKWHHKLKEFDAQLVNLVHDEWQVECPNDVEVALTIAKMMADSLQEVGEELGVKCPLAGSYWNDDHKDYTLGTNWYQTH